MRLRYKIGMMLVVVALALCLMTYQSYALWVISWQGKPNIVEVGCFNIEFKEADNTSSISLKNSYPISTEKALEKISPYQFTITNQCSVSSDYQVTLNTLASTMINPDPEKEENFEQFDMKDKIRFAIFKGEEKDPDDTHNLGEYVLENNGANINKDTTQIQEKLQEEKIDQSIILASGTLNGSTKEDEKESVTYSFYMWFDEAAGNEVMDKKFEASIFVVNKAKYVHQQEVVPEPDPEPEPEPGPETGTDGDQDLSPDPSSDSPDMDPSTMEPSVTE